MSDDSLFIVIEGLDGSGKSSAGRQLMYFLEQAYPGRIKLSFEPHDPSCGGLYIRQVLTKKITRFSHRTLALAFAANRLDHCDRAINPWLESEGKRLCISDRYYLSSLVYQSVDDFPMDEVLKLNEKARRPDLIFFLNVSNEVCYQRLKIRNQPPELFEQNLTETRDKFYKGIELLRQKHHQHIVEIDGNGSQQQTLAQMVEVLLEHWPSWKHPDLPDAQKFLVQTPDDSKLEEHWQTLFLSYCEKHAYRVGEYIEMSDAKRVQLSIQLQDGLLLNGIGLIVARPQQLDAVFRYLSDQVKTADFLLVFIPGPSEAITTYFEREHFPAIRILTEADLQNSD